VLARMLSNCFKASVVSILAMTEILSAISLPRVNLNSCRSLPPRMQGTDTYSKENLA